MKKEVFSVFPSKLLVNRNLSSLESIIFYLKQEKKLSYRKIASLLNRDDRTVWTCYSRAKKKLGVNEE